RRVLGQVTWARQRRPAGLTHPAGGLLGVLLLLGEVGQRDVRSLAGEGDGHRAADAGVTAGDQGPQPLQAAAAAVALLAVVGHGVHLGGGPRQLLLLGREATLLGRGHPGCPAAGGALSHGDLHVVISSGTCSTVTYPGRVGPTPDRPES